MVIRKKVEGRVDYNDGEFAEGQTIGIEGMEKDLWLGPFQIHRENTRNTPEEFRHRFSVGISFRTLDRHTNTRRFGWDCIQILGFTNLQTPCGPRK